MFNCLSLSLTYMPIIFNVACHLSLSPLRHFLHPALLWLPKWHLNCRFYRSLHTLHHVQWLYAVKWNNRKWWPKCCRPIHTCLHFCFCFCFLAAKSICMTWPNGLGYYSSVSLFFYFACGEAWSLQEQKSNLKIKLKKKSPNPKSGNCTKLYLLLFGSRPKHELSLGLNHCNAPKMCPCNCTPHTKNNVHHLSSAP